MDDRKRNLEGSKSRDAFKRWHKSLLPTMYASDIDFVLIDKKPLGIAAILDYKQPGDNITFAECIAYNDLLSKGYPIFIVEAEYKPQEQEPFQTFTIKQYLGGDWIPEPPNVILRIIEENITKFEYMIWESRLRRSHYPTAP